MCDTLYSLRSERGLGLLLEELVDLARGDADVLQHVALAQQVEDDFLADVIAVGGVVDPLLRECIRQLREGDTVALGDVLQRRVEGLVGDLDAGAVGALDLDLLQHQTLEHLLAQHVLRRQLELLLPQPLADRFDLGVQITVEHHAVVYDRHYPIEQLAAGGELAGLRLHARRHAEGGHAKRRARLRPGQNPPHRAPFSFTGCLSGRPGS